METGTMAKFQREVNSLQGLAILNIVFGGVAMALGISIGVQNISSVVQVQSLLFPQVALIALGSLAAAISMRWLISSAEILDGATDLKDDYETRRTCIDEDSLTGLIVRMTAHYRENKSTIKT